MQKIASCKYACQIVPAVTIKSDDTAGASMLAFAGFG
jgi:hypothetical protein